MLTKECPICKETQTYKHKQSLKKSIEENKPCLKCSRKESNKKLPQNQKGYSNPKYIGENNHMFGKSIFDIWGSKYDEQTVNILKLAHAEKSKLFGADNGMYGKCVFDIWVLKYGIDEALILHKQWKSKLGLIGDKNPAYGKPASKNSGRGIKGWICGMFFRSLLEMQFIYYCFVNNISIRSAETNEFSINYIDNGISRTYRPDFVLNDVIVEIKPSTLIPYHQKKIDAGYHKYKDKYKVYTEKCFEILIDKTVLDLLIQSKILVFVKNGYERAKNNMRYYKCLSMD